MNLLNDGEPIDFEFIEVKPFAELIEDEYDVFIIDYDVKFMKFFYNEFNLDKIKSLIIEIDCVDNVVDGEWKKERPSLFVMHKSSFEIHSYVGNEGRILFIEDYI